MSSFDQTLVIADPDRVWIITEPPGTGWAETIKPDGSILPTTLAMRLIAVRSTAPDDEPEEFIFVFPGEDAWMTFLTTLFTSLGHWENDEV